MEMFSKQEVSVPVTTMMVMEAYQHVKQGGEAAGIDGMTWEYLHTHRSRLLYQLWVRLASGSYFPKAIRAVSIPKKDGSKRVLGLPKLLSYYLFTVCVRNVFTISKFRQKNGNGKIG